MKKKWFALILSAAMAVSPMSAMSVMADQEADSVAVSQSSKSEQEETESTSSSFDETEENAEENIEESFVEISEVEEEAAKEEEASEESETPSLSAVVAEDGKSVELILSYKGAAENAQIQFPTWSEENGQDDLRWESAQRQEDGSFRKTINIEDYAGYGTYVAHAYLKSDTGLTYLAQVSFTVPKPEEKLEAQISEDRSTITITASGIDPKATKVQFPTWSEENDQDDLEWVSAEKSGNGVWKAEVSVKKHKNLGSYQIHCYQTVNGKSSFFQMISVELAKPQATVTCENTDNEKGSFTVRISDINLPDAVEKIQIPVWSEVNGQNDLVWYTAVKDGEDYTVTVNAGRHKYETGNYIVHCYIVEKNGISSFAGSASTKVSYKESLELTLSEDEKTIHAKAIGIRSDATKVVFPTWSDANDQDDLVWVQGSKNEDGEWTADIPVKGHKNTGKYNVHCYQEINGSSKIFKTGSVELSTPSAQLSVENLNPQKGTFTVRISNLQVPAGVEKVQLAVWGEADGQNDLTWQTAVKDGDSYVANVTAGQHKYEDGSYNIHCYITDGNNISSFAGMCNAEFALEEGLSVSVDADEKNARIEYIGSKAGDKLKAAVWSDANGQDDLKWYDLKQDGNGAVAVVPISNHKSSGKYEVHIYSGNTFKESSSFEISAISAQELLISNVDGNKGTFRVTLTGVSSVSGVDSVSIPVWPGNDQSKMKWYSAKKSGDSYYIDVDVANHGWTFGTYNVHAYVNGSNGVTECVKVADTSITADRYMYTESTGTYTKRIWIVNPGENVTKVVFPTWSSKGEQDDLVWYSGTKSGNAWYADISSDKHKHGGTYVTHCYATNSSGSNFAGSISYELKMRSPNSNQAMFDLAQNFSSSTQYLILVNRGLHRVAIYQGSQGDWTEVKYWPCVVGKPSTPTPTGTFQIKGRFYWFGAGHKSWWATQIDGFYYFHSQIYYWDDAPNKILDPTMDAAASAGCVRLYVDNAYWIWTEIPRGTTVHIYN